MKRVALSVFSVVLAVVTNIIVRSLILEDITPVGEKCFSGDYEGPIPFEPYLGGSFVCIMTTFFHELSIVPEGAFAFGLLATVAIAFVALIMVEAGRSGVRGILKYPIAIMVISQYIAFCVAVPLIWVPFCLLWGRGTAHEFSKYHFRYAVMYALWLTGMSIVFFSLDTQTYGWTFVAGIVGGPFLHLPLVGQWFLPTSKPNSDASSRLVAITYRMATVGSFMVWAHIVHSLLSDVGYDNISALYGALWENTNYAVKMILVDALVLFMAVLIVIWVDSPGDALRAILMAPLVGPGAALAHALGKQEDTGGQSVKVD